MAQGLRRTQRLHFDFAQHEYFDFAQHEYFDFAQHESCRFPLMSFPFGYLDKRYQNWGGVWGETFNACNYLYTILVALVNPSPSPPFLTTENCPEPHAPWGGEMLAKGYGHFDCAQ